MSTKETKTVQSNTFRSILLRSQTVSIQKYYFRHAVSIAYPLVPLTPK